MSVLRSPTASTSYGGGGSQTDLSNLSKMQVTMRKRKQPALDKECDCTNEISEFRKEIMDLLRDFTTNQKEHMNSIYESVTEIKNQIDNIQLATKHLTLEQNKLKTELLEIKNRNNTTEENIKTIETSLSTLKTLKNSEQPNKEEIIRELRERSDREKNIVIIGIPELLTRI